MNPVKEMRKQLRVVEKEFDILLRLRAEAKTEGGRLTEFGQLIVSAGREANVPQELLAKLLDLSPGAVSQRYNR